MRRAGVGQTSSIAETLDLTFAPTPAAPHRARTEISAWLQHQRADEALIEVSRLLVSELMTNSVRHAQTTGDRRIRLTASLHQITTLRIELFDSGVDGSVSRRAPSFEDGSGGFGLDLVSALSSAWGVDRGPRGTTVWLELPAHDALSSGMPTQL